MLIESLDKLGEKSEGGDDARLEIDHPASEGGGGGDGGSTSWLERRTATRCPATSALKEISLLFLFYYSLKAKRAHLGDDDIPHAQHCLVHSLLRKHRQR